MPGWARVLSAARPLSSRAPPSVVEGRLCWACAGAATDAAYAKGHCVQVSQVLATAGDAGLCLGDSPEVLPRHESRAQGA